MARKVDEECRRRWRTRLRRFKASGRTVVGFCEDEQVSAAAFYQWRKRLATELTEATMGPAFVPVQVTAAASAMVAAPSVPLANAAAAIEIHLPNGARVCLPSADAELLRVAIDSAAQAWGEPREARIGASGRATEATSC